MLNKLLKSRNSRVLFFFVLLALAPQARAELQIRGFTDLISSLTTTTDDTLLWIQNRKRDLTTEPQSRLGLNLYSRLSDQIEFAGQVVAKGDTFLTGAPGYILHADWLFFTYRHDDKFEVRFGRQIFPLFLFSEQFDVGFGYPWARLPNSVYGISPVKSVNGLQTAYNFQFGNSIEARVGAFYGSTELVALSPGIGGNRVIDRSSNGVTAAISGEKFKLQALYRTSIAAGSMYFPSPAGGGQITQSTDLGHIEAYGVGASWTIGNLTILSEGMNQKSGPESLTPINVKGFYATTTYQFDQLLTHLTYGRQWADSPLWVHPNALVGLQPGGRQTELIQAIAGLNYRLTDAMILKFEYEKDELEFVNNIFNFKPETYTLAVSAVFQ